MEISPYIRILILSVCLNAILFSAKAQTVDPLEINWNRLFNSERFKANAVIEKSGTTVDWKTISDTVSFSPDLTEINFFEDSILLRYSYQDEYFTLRFPNDIGLLFGKDKKELVEMMVLNIRYVTEKNGQLTKVENSESSAVLDTLHLLGDSKHNTLQQVSIVQKNDSIPVCSTDFPQAAVINAFNNSEDCNGIYPMMLIAHHYGQNQDSILTDIPSFIEAAGSHAWICRTMTESNNILILLEHSELRFNHMLYIRPFVQENTQYWLADLHAFIPASNVLELFGTHTQSGSPEPIHIE